MTIGIIGLGRLGAALARGLDGKGFAGEIYGFNRSQIKAKTIAGQVPDLKLCLSETELLDKSDVVFLWANCLDATQILERNAGFIKQKKPLIVSCTLEVPLSTYTSRWAECFPNINMPAGKGVTVIHFAPSINESDRAFLTETLNSVGTMYEVSAEGS